MQLTQFDKALLNLLQSGLPLTPAPFADLAAQLGCGEQQVLERLEWLKSHGLIRRVGAFFDAETLGYQGYLVALRVEEEKLAGVAAFLNALPQVTHNDEREHEFNLWFTVQEREMAAVNALIETVRKLPGVAEAIALKTTGRFKVNLEFQLK